MKEGRSLLLFGLLVSGCAPTQNISPPTDDSHGPLCLRIQWAGDTADSMALPDRIWLYPQYSVYFGYHKGDVHFAIASRLPERLGGLSAVWSRSADSIAIELLPDFGSGALVLMLRDANGGRGELIRSDSAFVDFHGRQMMGWKETSRRAFTATSYRCPRWARGREEWNYGNKAAIERN